MKPWLFLFFVLPFIGLAYVVWHVWHILPIPTSWKVVVATAMVLALACLFYYFLVGLDTLPLGVGQFVYEVGTSSLIVLLYLVMLFLLLDLGRLIRLVPTSFLHNSLIGSTVVAIFIVGLFIYSNIKYNYKERREIKIESKQSLENPLRFVLLSDMHIGYHNDVEELARWVDIINDASPDAVLVAGDIIDGSMKPLWQQNMAKEFRRLKAPVFACPGNHEYIAGIKDVSTFFDKAGITLLRDSSVIIGKEVTVIGRDDRSQVNRKSVAELVKNAPKTKFTIVLDHQPYHLERAAQAGADFQFSGHTHYGQVWPISWIEDAIYENAYGALHKGNTLFYVSSGIGIWGAKFRIGTCSEYVVVDLK